ncbi:MAG: hypothetical protein ACREQM_09610, partial [Candidatus Dormibacteraceae bacterium]
LWWGLVLATGCLGLLFFLLGASRLVPGLLNWGLGVLLAALVAGVGFAPDTVNPLVLVEAACLYAAAELGWLAASPPQVLTPPLLLLPAGILLAGLLVGYLALFGRVVPLLGGPLVTVAGVAAAICAFFILRGRRRRATSRSAPRSP